MKKASIKEGFLLSFQFSLSRARLKWNTAIKRLSSVTRSRPRQSRRLYSSVSCLWSSSWLTISELNPSTSRDLQGLVYRDEVFLQRWAELGPRISNPCTEIQRSALGFHSRELSVATLCKHVSGMSSKYSPCAMYRVHISSRIHGQVKQVSSRHTL